MHRPVETTTRPASRAPRRWRVHWLRSTSPTVSPETTSEDLAEHGQGPELAHRRRQRGGRSERGMGGDEAPVGHRGQGGDAVEGQVVALDGGRGGDGEHDGHGQRGQRHPQDVADAPVPEPAQTDGMAVPPLGQQAGHGQESGQGEQRRDPEVATLGPVGPEVERHRGQHRQTAKPVERREVGETPPGGGLGDGLGRRRVGHPRTRLRAPMLVPGHPLVSAASSAVARRLGCGGCESLGEPARPPSTPLPHRFRASRDHRGE